MNTQNVTNIMNIYPVRCPGRERFLRKKFPKQTHFKTTVKPLKKWVYNKNYRERNTRKQTHLNPLVNPKTGWVSFTVAVG